MTGVNTAEWLTAIDGHPDTIDADLLAGIMLQNGETTVEGKTPEDVQDAVEELTSYGFLQDVFTVDWSPGCEEHVLELRMPELPR